MKVPFVDLKSHHERILPQLENAIRQVIDDCAFVRGKYAESFEQNFAGFIGTQHCLGVGNGTDALYVALSCLGIGPGDEVITVANSFIATSEAITRTGAKVVFVDCDAQTYNINPDLVQAAITPKTKAIVPVHLYGQPAQMDVIVDIARQHDLRVVEDAAQAHGAQLNGRAAGTWGDAACFSFYPGKNLGAMGDAGAVVTDNQRLSERMRMLANHGRKNKYDHEFEGVNSRLDGIQAAILDIKLTQLAGWNERRIEIAGRYDQELRTCCQTPHRTANTKHVFHLYVVRVRERDRVREALAERGISTGIHYPIPLPLLEAYQHLGHGPSDFPVASRLKDEILSLPIHGEMTDAAVDYVIENFKAVMASIVPPSTAAVQLQLQRNEYATDHA